MASTKFILSKIKIEGVLQDIITKTTQDYVTVTYKGEEVTLASALADILADISNLPTDTGIDGKIEAAKTAVKEDIMGGAVPETLDTLKEIADYVEQHKEVAEALNEAIGNKVDKVEGKGLSTEDFTTEFKAILENLPTITADDVANWNNKVDKVEGKGLSTNDFTDELKAKLEGINGVRYGTEIPEDIKDGELFVQIVTETTSE